MKTGISENAFKKAAAKIGCEVRAVKAVDKVESKGSGFLSTGEVKILFEPHIFWKELRKVGVNPIVSDICYPKQGTKPYGKESQQHARLQKAVVINRNAALMSASWGRFQIMGFNFKLCGCKTLQEFINKMNESEESQLDLFVNYIINSYLDDELIEKDWKSFAFQYNGPLYYKNNYDGKLNTAYNLMK
ncbi:N-acetylmuramidase family protein [Flavobacterium sp.]|uniref:N-acetylmuramidase family protein n=1 Tax=Flavobacterium sp. TaxID=239 RepID=UPI002623A062|nr:N-acetylmuramidase family protein [Flavobacterium sp.]